MASLLRSTVSPIASSSSPSGPSLRRTFLPASGTTIHVTNPSALNSKQKRKRAKYVLLREDNRVLGSRGDIVTVNKTHAKHLYRTSIAAPLILSGSRSPQWVVPLQHAPTVAEWLHTPAASSELAKKFPLVRLLKEDKREVNEGVGKEKVARPVKFNGGLPRGYRVKERLEVVRREREERERREEEERWEKVEEEMRRLGIEEEAVEGEGEVKA